MTREEYNKLTPWQQGFHSFGHAADPEVPQDCPYSRESPGCSLWYAGWQQGFRTAAEAVMTDERERREYRRLDRKYGHEWRGES